MRISSLKLPILAIVAVAALAVVPAASATPLNLTYNSQTIGTVFLAQNGANVTATIQMNTGFAIAVQGPTVAFTGGLTNTSTLTGFSLNGVSVTGNQCGGFNQFSFTFCFATTGGQAAFPQTLSFTITNAMASGITDAGIHLCVLNVGSTSSCNLTTFIGSTPGTPPPPVPEPGTLSLLGTGLVGLAGMVRRRFRS